MIFDISLKDERVVLEITEKKLRVAKTQDMIIKILENFPNVENMNDQEIKFRKHEPNIKRILKELEEEEKN